MKQIVEKDQPVKFYTSIGDLPLRNFIDCIVDGNLMQLVRSGSPSQPQLQEAWAKISMEYADAIGSHENKVWLNLMKDITILELTLTQIYGLIEMLELYYHAPFAEMLNKLLFTKYTFDPKDPENYHKNLKSCLSRSKGIKIDLDLKRIHAKGLEEKAQNEATPYTKEYFQSLMVVLSDHVKYHIGTDISTFEFCERIKNWNAHCDQVRKNYKP